MAFNYGYLELAVAEKLQGLLSDDEILLYSKIIKDLKTGYVQAVNTFADLPTPSTVPAGSLYFVKNERTLYVRESEFSIWKTIVTDVLYNGMAWGVNGCITNIGSILGIGSTSGCRSSPISVLGGFTDWCQVSAGTAHSMVLRSDGSVWSWGCNSVGSLGDNSSGHTCSPVSVVGGLTDWCQINSGDGHSIGLRTNGTAYTWGENTSGQLGDGTTTNRSSPVSVIGGYTWCQVSAGVNISAAIRNNGTLWMWGCSSNGELGNSSTTSKTSPVSVLGGFTDWCCVAAGNQSSAALRSDGTAWGWGRNNSGPLGDGTTVDKSSPVSVIGANSWTQIDTYSGHVIALKNDGTMWSWGSNTNYEVGDGTNANKSSPVSVLGGFTDWCQISAGGNHSLGIRTNGSIWAWGAGGNGQLGDYVNNSNRCSPVSVVGNLLWCQVSGGSSHTLAIRVKQF